MSENKHKEHKLISYYKQLDTDISQEEISNQFDNLVRLIHAQEVKKKRQRLWISSIIATAAILVFGIFLFHKDTDSNSLMDYVEMLYANDTISESSDNGKFICMNVPNGCVRQVALPDGSFMKVNAGTTVVYPHDYELSKEREIYVDGEIFIDVTRDESKPFIVRTSDLNVTVLGTAFNVAAYKKDHNSEVVLLRGKVSVMNRYKQEVVLNPDEAVVLTGTNFSQKRSVDASDYISWTSGRLSFNGKNIQTIFSELSRFYGVNITYDPEIKDYSLKGTIDLNVSVDKALNRISKIIPINVFKKNDGYHLSLIYEE